MGGIIAPAAEALLAAAIAQAVKVINGENPDVAIAAFQAACAVYGDAVAEWEKAKKDNPSEG